MTTQTEALKLALEALKHTHPSPLTSFYTIGDRDKAIEAIEEHLAQPEQDCTRSHPHEEMSKECELRTEIARLTNCLSRVNAQAEHFEREWYLRGDEIERLKAQPEQEPVATVESVATVVSESGNQEVTMSWWHEPALPVGIKLYTAPPQGIYTTPPQRKPLTDERIADIVIEMNGNEPTALFWRDLAQAIEAAHGIKE